MGGTPCRKAVCGVRRRKYAKPPLEALADALVLRRRAKNLHVKTKVNAGEDASSI